MPAASRPTTFRSSRHRALATARGTISPELSEPSLSVPRQPVSPGVVSGAAAGFAWLEQQVPDFVIAGREPTPEERAAADETYYHAEQVFDPQTNYLMVWLLGQVVQHGTGMRAQIGRPAKGLSPGTSPSGVRRRIFPPRLSSDCDSSGFAASPVPT